jgi:Zn-dependent protease with chaperone function
MDSHDLGRMLVIGGLLVAAVGAVFLLGGGRLPGDLSFGKGNARVYIPLATCLIVSIVATIVLNLFSRR